MGGGVGEEGSWQQEVRRKAKSDCEGGSQKHTHTHTHYGWGLARVSSSVPGLPQPGAGGEKMVGEKGGGG